MVENATNANISPFPRVLEMILFQNRGMHNYKTEKAEAGEIRAGSGVAGISRNQHKN